MKLCKDCKWYKKHPTLLNDSYCQVEQNKQINIVTGEVTYKWSSAKSMRTDPWLFAIFSNECGKRGRFWEPKEKDEYDEN